MERNRVSKISATISKAVNPNSIVVPVDLRVFVRCTNCFGTGTVFRSSVFRPGLKCPICKGACKVPVPSDSKEKIKS